MVKRVTRKLSDSWFKLIHSSNLVYNTCWEDPRLDREAMQLGPEDRVLVITSAGCNSLEYALAGPEKVYAVDMNPRQNALLELKMAGIRRLDYGSFFQLFGEGRLKGWEQVYTGKLRGELSDRTRAYWDRRLKFFSGEGRRRSFYFYGASGTFALIINKYIDRVAKVRDSITSLLAATDVDEQRALYEALREPFWRPVLRWMIRRDVMLSLVGVPRTQRRQLELHYEGGIGKFVEDAVEAVFCQLPLQDNYFWRVYLTGSYTPECCPSYLREENFEALKAGRVDCIETKTSTVLGFLEQYQGTISRYVLLDHMDWLWDSMREVLAQEWQAIVDRAAPNARLLWRSAGLKCEYVNPIEVQSGGQSQPLGSLLEYQTELAERLHLEDRVHTYGSFYVADLKRPEQQVAAA